MQDSEGTLRLFFALWPDEATRQGLERTGQWLHRFWGGRRTREPSLHLTLVFLGSVPASKLETLRELAGAVRVAPFTLLLDRTGCWARKRIGWLGAGTVPAELERLVAELQAGLEAAALAFDKRPFVPHITLLRKATCAEAPGCQAIEWTIGGFALVESFSAAQGTEYRLLGEWPLQSPAEAAPADVQR